MFNNEHHDFTIPLHWKLNTKQPYENAVINTTRRTALTSFLNQKYRPTLETPDTQNRLAIFNGHLNNRKDKYCRHLLTTIYSSSEVF